MGKRGPAPQTEAQQRLRGRAGKRDPKTTAPDKGDPSTRVPAKSTRASTRRDASRPEPPDWLDREARLEWDRVCAALEAEGNLVVSDRAAIAMYCAYWSEWQALRAELKSAGSYLVEGARHNEVKTPLWQMWMQAGNALREQIDRLGLSPKARKHKPARPGAEAPPDPADQFLGESNDD